MSVVMRGCVDDANEHCGFLLWERPVGGVWSGPQLVYEDGGTWAGGRDEGHDVALDDGRTLTLVWNAGAAGDLTGELKVAVKPYGGHLTSPQTVGSGNAPHVAVSPNGQATLIWYLGALEQRATPLLATYRTGSEPFPTATLLDTRALPDPRTYEVPPTGTVDSRGNAYLTWRHSIYNSRGTGDTGRAYVVRKPAGADFQPPQLLGAQSASAGYPKLASNRAGQVVAGWWDGARARETLWANFGSGGKPLGKRRKVESGRSVLGGTPAVP
jgi:hypothetical protein